MEMNRKPIYLIVNCTDQAVDIRGHIIKNTKEALELKKYYENTVGCYYGNIIFTNSEADYNLFMDNFMMADSDVYDSILSLAQVRNHFITYGEINECCDKNGNELDIGDIVKTDNNQFGKITKLIDNEIIEITLLKEFAQNESFNKMGFMDNYICTLVLRFTLSTETVSVDSSYVTKMSND